MTSPDVHPRQCLGTGRHAEHFWQTPHLGWRYCRGIGHATPPVPARAVDREELAQQAFQIAYDGVDWNDTIKWVKPGPGEAAWTDVGTLRVQADEIVKQAVDALISAGLVHGVGTERDGGESRG